MGEQREVLGLHHKHSGVCVCVCLQILLKRNVCVSLWSGVCFTLELLIHVFLEIIFS